MDTSARFVDACQLLLDGNTVSYFIEESGKRCKREAKICVPKYPDITFKQVLSMIIKQLYR